MRMIASPTENVIRKCQFYLRIVTILQVCLKPALLTILHDPTYQGLPLNDEYQTHVLLLSFKKREERNLKRVLKKWQWDILCHVCTNCPQNCPRAGKTNTEDFDITIICVLLSNYLRGFPPPIDGWTRPLESTDYSKAACGVRARDLRNRTIGHGSCHHISTQQHFDDFYNETEKILMGLDYSNMQLFRDMRTASLDPYIQNRKDFFDYELKTISLELSALKTDYDEAKANNSCMKVDLDDIKMYLEKMQFVQDAFRIDTEGMKEVIDQMTTKQKEYENKQKTMTIEIEKNRLLIEKLTFNRKNIEKESLVVDGSAGNLSHVSQELKKGYQDKYGTLCLTLEPRKNVFEPVRTTERSKIIVKLSLVPSLKVFEMTDEKENVRLIKEKRKLSTSSPFYYKNIFNSNDEYVLISGVPGCGKTTLVETILHQWSINELWKEKFDFVFIIYFRQLLKFRSDPNVTCKKLLSDFYPGLDFSKITTHKSLLILDGFDEFAYKEDFRKTPEEFSPFVQAVYDLVDPNNPSIKFTRLLTSRPGSCSILFNSVFNQEYQQNLKIFQIIGFDDESIEQYVYNHLQDTTTAKEFMLKFQKSFVLQNFMTIPFFCWGICYLFNHKELTVDELPLTTTAIYANILTLFIRNHGLRNPALRLLDLFKSTDFQNMIWMLSKMAWLLYKEHKLIFNADDLKEFGDINVLLRSGLVIKVESDIETSDLYQFMHYSFQEFLCALHAFYSCKDVSSVQSNNIRIMVGGLCGGKVENSSSDPFIRSFTSLKESSLELDSFFHDELDIRFITDLFYELQNSTMELNVGYLRIMSAEASSYFQALDPGKLSHFLQRCDEGHLSIDVLHIEGLSTSLSTMLEDEGYNKIFSTILKYCTTLECHSNVLFYMNTEYDIHKMKQAGRLRKLYIRCYIGETDPSRIVGISEHLDCVNILLLTEKMREEVDWMKHIQQKVNEMDDTIRPRSITFYHVPFGKAREYDHNIHEKSIFDANFQGGLSHYRFAKETMV